MMIKNKIQSVSKGVVLIFVMVFFACGGSETSSSETTAAPQHIPPSAQTKQSKAGEVFNNLEEMGKAFVHEGAFQQGIQWEENGVSHFLIISSEEKGEFFSPSWESKLNLYHYQGDKLIGRTTHEVPNKYSTIRLKKNKSAVTSFEGSQKGPVLVYTICPDGEDPCTIHAKAYAGEKQYDLERLATMDIADFQNTHKAALEKVPSPIQEAMLNTLFSDY